MDLSYPARGILSPGFTSVVRTLAATRSPLTGRVVAELSALSQNGALKVLTTLESAGVVQRRPAGRAALFHLNRSHLLTGPLLQIVDAGAELHRRLAEHISGWAARPVHVSLFGSVARRDAGPTSDIDLLVVRPDTIAYEHQEWREQLTDLQRRVQEWTGSRLSWLELSQEEFARAVGSNEPIVDEWRRDGAHLAGLPSQELLSPSAATS